MLVIFVLITLGCAAGFYSGSTGSGSFFNSTSASFFSLTNSENLLTIVDLIALTCGTSGSGFGIGLLPKKNLRIAMLSGSVLSYLLIGSLSVGS
jgi:hypothetical protein